MPNDFKRKEPSKTDKFMFDLAMTQQQLERGLWSTSSLVMSLALLTKLDPKAIAELMVNGGSQIKEFGDKVNEQIKILEDQKRQAANVPANSDNNKEQTEVKES